MRRILTTMSLAYLLVAFGFTMLILVNASDEGEFVAIARADASAVLALCGLGTVVTVALGIRMLIDSKHRRDLERIIREPRRKSDAIDRDTRPE